MQKEKKKINITKIFIIKFNTISEKSSKDVVTSFLHITNNINEIILLA